MKKEKKTPRVNPRLTVKHSCNACRASDSHNDCSLGFGCRNFKPTEPCPKPKTINTLVEYRKLIDGGYVYTVNGFVSGKSESLSQK